jgi:chromosome segregation protein
MADVIFNGTDSRRALGMSEVSLTIGEVDQEHLKAAGVELPYSEVTLTRRIFRDGESEYFINKTPCRLKDIQQLFLGTGVGRASYSIMAQGHITQLLSSRPEDRRMVFEEAAGISRFKFQKREALRKLENTEQNLLRVSDLIREVKRQIGSLQRQAGKARRYKQCLLELQHLDTQLARHQFDVLQVEIHERQAVAESLRAEMEVCSAGVLREEDEITQLRGRQAELERQLYHTQQQGLELKGQVDHHLSRIQFNQERLQELAQQNTNALNDIAQGEERRLAAERELALVTERLAGSAQTLAGLQQTLQSKRDALRQVENSLRDQQEALRQAQSEAFAAAQQLTRVRNEITALDFQKQGNTVRLEKLSAEKIQLEQERSRLEARFQEFCANVEAEKLGVQTRRGSVEEQQERLRQVQAELAQVTKSLDELLRHQAGIRSRLGVLEQLQAEYEGFSAGALAVLRQSPQVLGPLVDRIRVPEPYVAAVEAALGHHLQLVLTELPETAQQILVQLKASHKGRASIAPLALKQEPEADSVPGQTAAKSMELPVCSGPAVAGDLSDVGPVNSPFRPVPALRVMETDSTVRSLLERLLGSVLIVPDLATATDVWRESNGQFDLVTLAGEILSRQGVFTGGSLNESEKTPASLLGRKNQIAELERQVDLVQEQVRENSRCKGALQSEQTVIQASLQQAQTELRSQEVAMATHQGEIKALENALRLLEQKVETVVYEIQNLAEQEKAGQEQRQGLLAQSGELEIRERASQQRVADGNAALENLRQQRDAAHNALTETKVALATEEQLGASFQHQQQSHDQRIRELTNWLEQRRAEIASLLERRAQLQAEVEESQLTIETLQHEREQVGAQTAELLGQKETLEREISSRDEALRQQRRRLTEFQEQRSALEVDLAQKSMSVQNLRERIQQKYQVNLDGVRSECITITFADEGPARVETLTPDEMAARGLATDWAAVAEQVAALQRRLEEMGPVNLVAIEEYEETEQRYQLLTTQHDDLVKAREQLLDVMNRINTQTRQMFSETLNKVRENFSALFTEVFGGGKADLQLVDEGDVLESGIEILARPPGKQLKSISLLSGGEQTMTAVALLFAIYQVKPSPFCVLDELDAPLDESNINRFIGVLKRFLAHSQFIIITHNKRTIGMADVIYGVTMEETGVSKIISMRFRKTSGTLTDQPQDLTASAEMPAPPPMNLLEHQTTFVGFAAPGTEDDIGAGILAEAAADAATETVSGAIPIGLEQANTPLVEETLELVEAR